MKNRISPNLRHSLCALGWILLGLGLLVGFNLGIACLPQEAVILDTSHAGLYTLSQQTHTLLEALTQDITVYHIYAAGKEDPVVSRILEQYADRSDHIRILWRDPGAYPDFVGRFTTSELPDNSLILVDPRGESVVISFSQLYVADYEEYYASGNVVYNYAVEAQVTAALNQLAGEGTLRICQTIGHGEQQIPTTLLTACGQQGMRFLEVNLLSLSDLPQDCDCLLVFNPQRDFTQKELQVVAAYLDRGGSMLLVADYVQGGRPNLEALVEERYGVLVWDGVVMEADGDHSLAGYPYYLLPALVKHQITKPLISGGYDPVVPIAQGLTLDSELPSDAVSEVLLRSSSESYLVDPYTMTAQEDAPEGGYALAIAGQQRSSGSRLVYLSSAALWEDQTVRQSSGANQDLVLNCFGWLCQSQEMISLHAKSASEPRLTPSQGEATRLSVVMIGLIPGGLLTAGLWVTYTRRRKA